MILIITILLFQIIIAAINQKKIIVQNKIKKIQIAKKIQITKI